MREFRIDSYKCRRAASGMTFGHRKSRWRWLALGLHGQRQNHIVVGQRPWFYDGFCNLFAHHVGHGGIHRGGRLMTNGDLGYLRGKFCCVDLRAQAMDQR